MGYRPEIYRQAQEIMQRRRMEAESTAHAHRLEAESKIPVLQSINKQIAQAGLQAAKALGMKEDAQSYLSALADANLQAQQQRRVLLREAGFPEDYLAVRYTCAKCSDTGFVDGLRCDCFESLLRDLAYADLEQTAPLSKHTFDSFRLAYYSDSFDTQSGVVPRQRMEEILVICKRYAREFHTHSASVFMYGETGLGKTHLSLAIAAEVVRSGFHVVYGSAQNLLERMEREHFRRDNEGASQEIMECDLLILDDLGAEFSTQFTTSAVYNIINTRLQSGRPVIISTNLPIKELEKRYTRRVISRIFGSYMTLSFCGTDIRQKLH